MTYIDRKGRDTMAYGNVILDFDYENILRYLFKRNYYRVVLTHTNNATLHAISNRLALPGETIESVAEYFGILEEEVKKIIMEVIFLFSRMNKPVIYEEQVRVR